MAFELEKEAAKVRFILEKHGVPGNIIAQVCTMYDLSGSTQKLFYAGAFQESTQRFAPIALTFDDNGECDSYGFCHEHNGACRLESIVAENYEGYVRREILDNEEVPKWGYTYIVPVLMMALQDYGFLREVNIPQAPVQMPAEKPGFLARLLGASSEPQMVSQPPKRELQFSQVSESGYPVIIYVQTDGDFDDQDKVERLLKQCEEAKCNVYFHFIGIGTTASFKFLNSIADELGNVGFVHMKDFAGCVDQDDFYEKLLPVELINWLRPKK